MNPNSYMARFEIAQVLQPPVILDPICTPGMTAPCNAAETFFFRAAFTRNQLKSALSALSALSLCRRHPYLARASSNFHWYANLKMRSKKWRIAAERSNGSPALSSVLSIQTYVPKISQILALFANEILSLHKSHIEMVEKNLQNDHLVAALQHGPPFLPSPLFQLLFIHSSCVHHAGFPWWFSHLLAIPLHCVDPMSQVIGLGIHGNDLLVAQQWQRAAGGWDFGRPIATVGCVETVECEKLQTLGKSIMVSICASSNRDRSGYGANPLCEISQSHNT